MPSVDHCVWNSISILPGESSKVTMSSSMHLLPFFVIMERGVFFLLSDVQKSFLLNGRKSLDEQTFTQKRLVSIRKELFAGQSGRSGLQQNREQS